MNKHIILADQSLVNYMGHSFEYARSIRSEAQSLDYKVTVLANKSVSKQVINDIEAIPCFRYGLDHGFDSSFFRTLPDDISRKLFREWNYKRHAQTLYADLSAIEKNLDINSETIVIFHTIRHNHILPIVKWSEHLPQSQRPSFVLVFHFTAYPNFTQPSETAEFYSRSLRYLENSPVQERFHLFADSQELVDEYRNYTNANVNVIPIPHATLPETSANVQMERNSSSPIRLTYLGDARTNKGFHLLPYMFRKIESMLKHGKVEAEIQSNVRNQSEWQVKLAVNRLRQQKGITLYENNLSTKDYYNLLNRADIILLPYTLDYYHSQTSGIFSEALAHGKPTIVSNGTWMARQTKQYGAAITFLPEDCESFTEAVINAIHKYDDMREKAINDALPWKIIHCSSAYLNTILDSICVS